MAADLSHLLSVDAMKHKYEKTVKEIVLTKWQLFYHNHSKIGQKNRFLVAEHSKSDLQKVWISKGRILDQHCTDKS